MATLLGELTFLGVTGGVARLVGPREMVQAARAKVADLEALFRQAVGSPVKVQIESAGGDLREVAAEMGADRAPSLAAPQTPKASMQEHPLVRQAVEQLGATLVRVQPRVKPPSES